MALGAWTRALFTRQAPAPVNGSGGNGLAPGLAGGGGGGMVISTSPERAYFAGSYFGGSAYFGENLAAVTSAVTLIGRTIGSLPTRVYQQTEAGPTEVFDHPVCRLLARPDGGDGILTWPDLCEWWIASALLSGNGLCGIEDDGRGAPTALRPVPWWCANPLVNPNTGRVTFQVAATNLPWWPSFAPQVISSSDALWLRDRSDAGVLGRSALSRAPQVLQLASQAQTFAGQTFADGAKLAGSVEHPGRLSTEASQRIASSWRETHAGPWNAGKVLVLEEGMKFSPYAMTLEDAELLASRKFETEEIARLFNIPLPILNIWDHSTFTNSDTASQWFGQLTLAPWCRKIEAEFSRTLFNDPRFSLRLDLAALMRGSYSTRIQAEINLVRAGILSADEVRLSEGYRARGGRAAELVAQATGGRPEGAGDGAGDSLPAPGVALNGSGRGNGANGAVMNGLGRA